MSDDRLIGTLAGASSVVAELRDDEPTCRHSTVLTSQHAANSGSQSPEWIDGMRNAAGFSENVTA